MKETSDPLNCIDNGTDKIKIEYCTSGDSRVAKEAPTIEEFDRANKMHQNDVTRLCARFMSMLSDSVRRHDWSKTEEPYRSMFYRDLCDTINGRINFTDGKWGALHYNELERHHLQQHAPKDVNLFDVIEMMLDHIAAGTARNMKELLFPEITPDILMNAFQNTVALMNDQVDTVDKYGVSLSIIDDSLFPVHIPSPHSINMYKCPRCGVNFEYYDALSERGFTRVNEHDYRHDCCGQLIYMGDR